MSEIRLIETDGPTPEQLQQLVRGIADHATDAVGDPGFRPLAILAEDAGGNLVAGISGSVNWTWLSIKLLWVAPSVRGIGLGRRLMDAFENLGRTRGCASAHVDTLAFQAPGFYERLGYERFAEIPDYAPGAARIYFKKSL